jgi:6-phosphogluconolactonase (cycloisomerase 2 family)
LVSIQPLPQMQGAICEWVPASSSTTLASAMQRETAASQSSAGASGDGTAKRNPLRVIKDAYPTYSAVAVDVVNNEVVLQDENLFQILVYDRMANTPPTASWTEPKRVIGGHHTKLEFNCALYVDPKTGDIFSVNNDTVDTMVIFDRNAKGDVPPTRELSTPHGTFGIAVDEAKQEMFLTVQHSSSVVVYAKGAAGEDAPLRHVQGNRTRLADPHGIALDTKNGLMFVANYGSSRELEMPAPRPGQTPPAPGAGMPRGRAKPGTGKVGTSSITVYPIDARGDVAPLRVIEGPKTQLNWPAGMMLDEDRGELYVANDAGDSVLVFRTDASGDAAPIRMLKGPRTGVKNPTSITLDKKNNELWVANFGNHTATVFRLSANGDVAPLRTIRSGPLGQPTLMIGNPGSVAYDTKREEILVPN